MSHVLNSSETTHYWLTTLWVCFTADSQTQPFDVTLSDKLKTMLLSVCSQTCDAHKRPLPLSHVAQLQFGKHTTCVNKWKPPSFPSKLLTFITHIFKCKQARVFLTKPSLYISPHHHNPSQHQWSRQESDGRKWKSQSGNPRPCGSFIWTDHLCSNPSLPVETQNKVNVL